MEERQARALEFLRGIAARDTSDGLESLESLSGASAVEGVRERTRDAGEHAELVERTLDKIASNASLDPQENFALEAIIIPDQRPVLDVLSGNLFITDHPLWQSLLAGSEHDSLVAALPSVGRVELPGHPSLPYGGTGFVVGSGILMTNRHVAEIFTTGLGIRGLEFRPGLGAALDLEQRVDGGSFRCEVRRTVMIHPYWDMALLEVEGLPESARPLSLSGNAPAATSRIAAIGYPAFDPRNDAAVQQQVFRGIYNVKRIMPGLIMGTLDVASFGKTLHASAHDSSTLGGASGSAVIDLATGAVVALHFGGAYLKSNYGVPTAELARDPRVVDAGLVFADAAPAGPVPWNSYWSDVEAAPPANRGDVAAPQARMQCSGGRLSVSVPLRITIDLGDPVVPRRRPQAAISAQAPVTATEAPVADYRGRKGYRPDFLGDDVTLPEVRDAAADVFEFDDGGTPAHELRYEHFSVVMSRSRRLCFFSAVNIDGATSRKSRRVAWRTDPRIPPHQQILNECYGNPPKFSRGHMTRREDPVWGAEDSAALGNADSMHVTNTVPQMQAFNSPIWLGLEDYALQHAREDDMRLCVFTGPYFREDDPVIDGVAIPVAFWKVIAFIHDDTGRLCATGYEMDQTAVLTSREEFVFGDYVSPQTAASTQVATRAIERRSGLSFGGLADIDPLGAGIESVGAAGPLEQFEQIRFV